MDNKDFVWTADLVAEFCEYAGMRIGKTQDIKQQVNLLMEDFKQSKTIPKKEYDVQCIVVRDKRNYWLQKDGEYSCDLFERHIKLETLLSNGGKIHSVKRLSDGEVFTIGDKTHFGFIENIGEPHLKYNTIPDVYGQIMAYHSNNGGWQHLCNLKKVEDKKPILTTCNMCGSNLVEIRAKYPNGEPRTICPTCTMEKLEQIQEISNPNYGKTYQTNSQ